VFDVSEARMLLRGDVVDEKHLTMQPALLHQSRREYNPFKPRKFKKRIYRAVRGIKFINYLEQERAVKGLA